MSLDPSLNPSLNQDNESYDVFISYRHDTCFYLAHILYTKFITNGYTVFIDKTLDSGRFEDKIHLAIQNSRNFVMVLSEKDKDALGDEESWLNKEARWALECTNLNIIPVMCDGFRQPTAADGLTEAMRCVMKNNGVLIHQDYSLDSDLDNLCDHFLKNVNPLKPRVTDVDFFQYNLEVRKDRTATCVDVAFHAGAPWLMPGAKNSIFTGALKRGVRWRVLINSVEAAESIARNMRDDNAMYISFDQAHEWWKKFATLYPDCLEVRVCEIPMIHVYHAIEFDHAENEAPYGTMHVKYYAYNNTRLDNAFEHEISSYSKYYSIYRDEFEFLWSQSKKI